MVWPRPPMPLLQRAVGYFIENLARQTERQETISAIGEVRATCTCAQAHVFFFFFLTARPLVCVGLHAGVLDAHKAPSYLPPCPSLWLAFFLMCSRALPSPTPWHPPLIIPYNTPQDLFAIAVDQPFRFPATFTFVLRWVPGGAVRRGCAGDMRKGSGSQAQAGCQLQQRSP